MLGGCGCSSNLVGCKLHTNFINEKNNKRPPSSSSGGAAKPKETIQKPNCSTPEPEGFLHNKVALTYYLVANPCPVAPLPCMLGFMLSSRFPWITHKTYKQNVLS